MNTALAAREPEQSVHYTEVCDSEDRALWLAKRNEGIGASEIAAVLGVSPWQSALSLYAQKTGQMEPDDLSENEAVFWGLKLENSIIDGYAERTGRLVRRFGKLIRSTAYPWLQATPDALTSDDGGKSWWPLQIKNIGFSSAAHWEDGAPDYYRMQVMHESLVFGSTKTTAAALVAGQKLIWEDVEVDEISARKIINLGRDFWDRVQRREAPPADGTAASAAALKALYPRETDGPVKILPASLCEIDAALADAKARKSAAEKEITAAENLLKEAIGDAASAVLPDGTLYTFKTTTRGSYVVAESSYRQLRRKAPKGEK